MTDQTGASDPPRTAVESLACGALRGPRDEAWRLFRVAWPLMERFVKARLVREKIAWNLLEDCGQNVFTRVWRYRCGYRGETEGQLWKWIRTIADNERKRMQGREAARPAHVSLLGDGEDIARNPAAADDDSLRKTIDAEQAAALRDCLSQLDEKHRSVIELAYFPPALSERAAAEVLGWSASNIHKIKTDAQRKLLRCLRSKGID